MEQQEDPSGWRTVGYDQQETTERLVAEARTLLASVGLDVRNSRFPFAMHHDFYRTRIRLHGKKPRHADVARLLDAWAAGRSEGDYARQAITGAVLAMDPGGQTGLPREVSDAMEAVGGGAEFAEWLTGQGGVTSVRFQARPTARRA